RHGVALRVAGGGLVKRTALDRKEPLVRGVCVAECELRARAERVVVQRFLVVGAEVGTPLNGALRRIDRRKQQAGGVFRTGRAAVLFVVAATATGCEKRRAQGA